MNKSHELIEWTEFPSMADFEGVAIISRPDQGDDADLDSHEIPVSKRGDELVFVGAEIDFVAQYSPDRAVDFPRLALSSALWHSAAYRSPFASRHIRKDGSLKKGCKLEIKLFKNTE